MIVMMPEPSLFVDEVPAESVRPSPTSIFAEVVFDRPIDQVYTYAVVDEFKGKVQAGVRVEAPFGRGDKLDTGYVVNVHRQTPPREVKSIVRVLDAQPLITPAL